MVVSLRSWGIDRDINACSRQAGCLGCRQGALGWDSYAKGFRVMNTETGGGFVCLMKV